MKSIFIGIDPGFNGALAALDDEDNISIVAMPTKSIRTQYRPQRKHIDGQAIVEWFKGIGSLNIRQVLIEQAIVMPKQGAVSGAKFVGGQRYITGLVEGMGLPCEEILPAKWKRDLDVWQGRKEKNKEASVERARELFPNADFVPMKRRSCGRTLKDSHDFAEAAILAWYARKRWYDVTPVGTSVKD